MLQLHGKPRTIGGEDLDSQVAEAALRRCGHALHVKEHGIGRDVLLDQLIHVVDGFHLVLGLEVVMRVAGRGVDSAKGSSQRKTGSGVPANACRDG